MSKVIPIKPKTERVELFEKGDYRHSKNVTYVQCYWGYQRIKRFAILPVWMSDGTMVWWKPYYAFWTNTGYDKHAWRWKYHGSAATFDGIYAIEREFLNTDRRS